MSGRTIVPTNTHTVPDDLWAEYLRAVDADLTGLSAIDIARILRYRRKLFARIYSMLCSPSPRRSPMCNRAIRHDHPTQPTRI